MCLVENNRKLEKGFYWKPCCIFCSGFSHALQNGAAPLPHGQHKEVSTLRYTRCWNIRSYFWLVFC